MNKPTFGSLFSGIGGLDLGLERAGWECRWQVEIDPFCQRVLDKHWPDVEKWYGNVAEADTAAFEPVDLIAGGFPCQDVSYAGNGKRGGPLGLDGERSGLWREFARFVGDLRPRLVLVENVGALTGRGLGRVVGELSSLGYDAEWSPVLASDFGASHFRTRLFIVGKRLADRTRCLDCGEVWCRVHGAHYTDCDCEGDEAECGGCGEFWDPGDQGFCPYCEWVLPDADRLGAQVQARWEDTTVDVFGSYRPAERTRRRVQRWPVEPRIYRSTHGLPNRVDRLRALGNAVVPQVAEYIGRRLMEVAS